jgi:hypothetical protein
MNPQPYGRDDTWTIENNSEGFRGAERRVNAAGEPRVYRILCVGDSITFGFNVDQPDAYPRQVERLLAARYPGRVFEVVNAGVPGWSWLQGLRFLETRGLPLHPDVVVMGHGTNDQLLPARVTDEERFHRLAGRGTKLWQSIGVALARTKTYRLVERVFPPPPFAPDQDSPGCQKQIQAVGRCSRVSVDEIAAAVHEVRTLTQAAGIDLLIANLDFTQTPAVNGVRRTVESDRLPFVDTVAEVRARRRRDEEERAVRLGLKPASYHAPDSKNDAAPKRVLLRAVMPDRTGAFAVEGTGYFQPQFAFSEAVHDDGTHGDEVAGDGVYSTTIEVPATVPNLTYHFVRNGEPEFKALPPLSSTMADRLLTTTQDTIAPVHVFGEDKFMAERAHPNREGQAIVAGLVVDGLATIPSFQRFVDSAP